MDKPELTATKAFDIWRSIQSIPDLNSRLKAAKTVHSSELQHACRLSRPTCILEGPEISRQVAIYHFSDNGIGQYETIPTVQY